MSKRAPGIVLLVLGIVVLLVALGADVVGLGNASAFGTKQIIGVVAGVVIGAVGITLLARK